MKQKKDKRNSIWKQYTLGYNQRRITFEVIIPVVIAIAMVSMYVHVGFTPHDFMNKVTDINSYLTNIWAIQIGFNITALALIVSFNKSAIKESFSAGTDLEKIGLIQQLLASFAYCVLVQTGLIIIGTVFMASTETISLLCANYGVSFATKNIVAYIFTLTWFFLIGHSFSVFCRNVMLIYKFILVMFKK